MRKSKIVNLVLILLFYASPIIDNIYGYMYYQMNITTPISVLFRTLILGLVVLSLSQNVRFKKYFIIATITSILLVSIWVSFYNASLTYELSYLIRILYIPLLMLFFVENKMYIEKSILYKYIINYGLIISSVIIITFVLGIGNYSYGDGEYGFGMKGFFKAGNDLSLTIVFCLCFSIVYYVRYYASVVNIGRSLIIAIGGILVGSRVGMVLCPLIFGCFLLYLFLFSHRIPFIVRTVIILVLSFFSIKMLSNIIGQMDSYALARFEMDNIESARTVLTDEAQDHINSFNSIDLIIGRGSKALMLKVASGLGLGYDEREVEADRYEIIGALGYGVGWLYLCIYFYLAFKCFCRFINKMDMETSVVFGLSLLFIVIGYLAGHAVKNVMIAPLMGVVAYLTFTQKKSTRINYNHKLKYEKSPQCQ